MFYEILEGRNAILDNKNKKFKKSKNWDFSKEVSPWFWLFILGTIGQKNVFYDILEGRNAFLDYKSKNFKKSNNWDCSKWG